MPGIQALTTLPDPRRRRGRHYPLFGLRAIVLRAAMHGERSFRGRWRWARARQDDLRTHPALGVRAVRRIPRRATFGSAGRTTPAGERERALAPLLPAERDLARDGTWLRGSTRDATDALRSVTLAGVTVGQVWAQRAVSDGDEWAAALALREAFPRDGKVISADAGLVRPPFVQNAVEKKGGSIGRITPNQPDLPQARVHGSGMPDARAPDGVQTVTRHGRGARRALWIAPGGDLSPYLEQAFAWPGVQSRRWIARTRWRAGREETRRHVGSAGAACPWSLTADAALARLQAPWTRENHPPDPPHAEGLEGA